MNIIKLRLIAGHKKWKPRKFTPIRYIYKISLTRKFLPVENIASTVVHCFIWSVTSAIFKQIFDCGHWQHENQRRHSDVLPKCIYFWD